MTKALASIVSLALALALGTGGALACPCGADTGADEAPMGCHETGPGFAPAPMSCGCACLAPAPAPGTATRLEPIAAGFTALHEGTPAPTIADLPGVTLAVAPATTSPPAPSRHQILRI